MAAIHVLTYAYVDDVVELRAPHREAHLAHIERWQADGGLAMAGATGDPPTGALFVFEAESDEAAREFAEADPYVAAGLVTAAMIEPWDLVAHRNLESPGA